MVTQDFPPIPGGIQTYSAELALRFHRSLSEFAVVAPGVEGAEDWDRSVPYRVIRVGRSSDHVPLTAIPALVRLGREGFDTVFHTQWQTVAATVFARSLGGPTTLHLAAHGRELLLRPLEALPSAQWGFDQLRRRAIHQASKLFPVSRFTAGLLKELGASEANIVTVPNGTDPSRFRPMDVDELKKRHGLSGRPVILSVGRLAPRKGFDTVIEALPRIIDDFPDVCYVLVGDGADRERLEGLVAAKQLADSVRFIGRVDWSELPHWHNVADVFVTPSRHTPPSVEGFGIVFLEANACGKPVIGARTGGIPDAVLDGETGLLVEADQPNELADALHRLLSDREFALRLGTFGRERVLSSGTWDHVHDTLYHAMNECS